MLRLSCILLLALALAGCSATRLAYNNVDWLIDRRVKEYIDFAPRQREEWEKDLERVHALHRRIELPHVVGLLTAIEAAVRDGLDEATLQCLVDEGHALARRHGRIAVELGAPLLAGLDPAQVNHLEAAMAARNEDYRDKYLAADPQQRRDARVERILERITRWTGRLTNEQRAMVEAEVVAMPDLAQPWFDYRKERQERLLELLRAGADAVEVAEFLSGWWVEGAARPRPLIRATDDTRSSFLAMLVRLYDAMEPAQHRRTAARIAELRADLAGLTTGPESLLAGSCRGTPTVVR
ncbi:MAG: DUF6279 family lipoprotein [Gammaproteobacteria bacterium]|nr:DUF6279 family lipoprotein [Gammaproteobacteria bacterium]